MEKRKSAPVWGLFFRELYPLRKELITCYVIGIVFGFICWLIKLSMEIGNLANMPEETITSLRSMLPGYAIYFPGILFMAEVSGSLNSFLFEMSPKFRCFTASIPVSEWKFVGVKYLSSSAILVVGTLFAFLNAFVMCSVFDTTFDTKVVSTILFCGVCVSIFCVLLYTANYLFRNPMTALVAGLVVTYGAMIALIFIFEDEIDKLTGGDDMQMFTKLLEKFGDFTKAFMPYSIPCTILFLTLGWVLCSLLAKRREK